MPFDYKKEYKEFYMPPNKPTIVDVPAMNYIAVRGEGDPNCENGYYQTAIGLLATVKKKTDFSQVEFITYTEGLCVQCMHVGAYDNEPETVEMMNEYAQKMGYEIDITDSRYHHEIYLSDFRKTATDKLKTVIRYPIKKML